VSTPETRLRLLATATLCVALCLLLPSTGAAVKCVTEVVSCGGGPSESASYRSHDTLGQGPVGPTASGQGYRVRDGFWVTLPFISAPVEGSYYGTMTVDGTAMIRWTVGSLHDILGFNVYRSTSAEGPFELLNATLLPAESPGSYEDATVWPGSTFWYELRAILVDGTEDVITGEPVMLETEGSLSLALRPACPNPFTNETTLHFDVPDHVGGVRLAVYNVNGQVVRTLVDDAVGRGRYELTWDGCDDRGKTAATGVYFARLEVDGRCESQKVMLLR
jgi:hypothetical protein